VIWVCELDFSDVIDTGKEALFGLFLTQESISKMGIRVQGKARGDAQSRRGGMSILSRPATPPWGLRPIFEMGSSVASLE
jgi:hypothetical protein